MEVDIAAILLAAGLSTRMGEPKLLLPLGGTTVLGKVVSTFAAAGMEEIVVVTGADRQQIERLLAKLSTNFPLRVVYNPAFAKGEMLSSIQTGLTALDSLSRAAMIGLGDQPQVRAETIMNICAAFVQTNSPLVIPSFQNRRGHPWLAARSIWPEILALPLSTTPRHFLNTFSRQITYVDADESILQDLDTPDDYARLHL